MILRITLQCSVQIGLIIFLKHTSICHQLQFLANHVLYTFLYSFHATSILYLCKDINAWNQHRPSMDKSDLHKWYLVPLKYSFFYCDKHIVGSLYIDRIISNHQLLTNLPWIFFDWQTMSINFNKWAWPYGVRNIAVSCNTLYSPYNSLFLFCWCLLQR